MRHHANPNVAQYCRPSHADTNDFFVFDPLAVPDRSRVHSVIPLSHQVVESVMNAAPNICELESMEDFAEVPRTYASYYTYPEIPDIPDL